MSAATSMRWCAVVAVALTTIGASAKGQSIAGIVRDRHSGVPLAHIAVALRADSAPANGRSRRAREAQTDSAGIFELDRLPAGRYQLELSRGKTILAVAGPYTVAPDSEIQRVFAVEMPPPDVFFEDEVDLKAQLVTSTPAPRYPTELRAKMIEGDVIVQYVVDTLGGVDSTTIRTVYASDPLFDDAVRAVLPRFHFLPAEKQGRKVKALIQQPFGFALNR